MLCERGGFSNRNPGNRVYLQYGRSLQEEYQAANGTRKTELINQVFEFVRRRGGRFIKRDPVFDLWYVIDDRKARIKIGQLLRTI